MDTAQNAAAQHGDLPRTAYAAGEGAPEGRTAGAAPIAAPTQTSELAGHGNSPTLGIPLVGPSAASQSTPSTAAFPKTARLFDDEHLEDELGREVIMSAGPRRTAETEAAYATRVRQLYNAAALRRGVSKDLAQTLPPGEVVQDLIETGPQRSLASWRLYRSALLWHLAQHRRHAPEYQAAYDRLVATKVEPASRDVGRAKARQGKNTIPEKDLKQLLNTLAANAMRSRTRQGANWAERTQYWLHASLATGLRPNEWETAHWANEGREVLMAPNSKAKVAEPAFHRVEPGRSVYDDEFPPSAAGSEEGSLPGSGEDTVATAPAAGAPVDPEITFRAIPVPEEARDWVSLHLDSIRDSGVDFSFYYERCRQALWRACKIAFKGRVLYSLYTMRSQFSANAKASMPLEDVGALMGHSDPSNKTTKRNYGPRTAAHGSARGLHWDQADRQAEPAQQLEVAADQSVAAAQAGDIATG